MRRGPARLGIAIGGATLLFALAIAAFAPAQTIFVEVGDLRLSFSATIKPKALPRSKPAPIAVSLSSRFETKDGSRVPPMTQAAIGIDRSVSLDSRGVPTCTAAQLESQTTEGAEAACPAAIVGAGTATIEIASADGPPAAAQSRVLAFNGGTAGRVTTVFLHAYLSSPVSEAIVVPVTLTKLPKGGYGMRALVTVPKIAAGAGSLVGLDLAFRKQVAAAGGGKHGYLLAKCSDGNFVFEPGVEFEGGAFARGTLVSGCAQRGG